MKLLSTWKIVLFLGPQSRPVTVSNVHGDRLVGSLCSPILNHRTDEYGGDLANRTRFALTLVRRLKAIVPDMVIDYKLPIVTPLGDNGFRGKGGLPLDEAAFLQKN